MKKGKSAGVDNIPTGPSRWIGCNHRSHDNLQQDLVDRRMANPMDSVLSHHTSQERQLATVPELPNNKPHQSPKQSHAENYTEETEATSGEDHRRRTGRLKSRKEQHRADLQCWMTTSKNGHSCPCQNCSQGPPAVKSGRESLLNRLSCPPTTQSVKGLN